MMSKQKGIKLNIAISLLIVFTALSITLINWYLSSNALKTTLTKNHLDNNYRYALKVASSTNDLMINMQRNLGTLAEKIGTQTQPFEQQELDNWLNANLHYYNSLFTTDSNGTVQLMSPQVVPNNQKGVRPGAKIESPLMKEALVNRKFFISDPYLAQTGNLMVLISYPLFNRSGQYLGVVDGTIYLEGDNSLQKVLSHHEFLDESSVFVVDRLGRIIYHPEGNRINETIADHPLVQQLMNGENGAQQIINRKGVEYFSGYAYVEETGWGIIAQTPTTVIEEPLKRLTIDMITQSLPFLLPILILSWLFANQSVKPINQLAKFSEIAATNPGEHSIHQLEIKSYIFEVRQLYHHLRNYFQLLNNQIQLDGLTGLLNRRAFDQQLENWMKEKESFSLIMLDIDRFKRVNDDFGHLVGDDVLRFLAANLIELSRQEDLCYRYGGEEFAILLYRKDEQDAFMLAERIREKIANTPSPTGEPITISLGITSVQNGDTIPQIIKRADKALYQSKNNGRNVTTIFKE